MEPLFLDAAGERLFAIHHPAPSRGTLLVHCPAFAEEMNKSRRMVALQARAFAAAGLGVLLFDPTGTGDSTGEFADATWERWLDDAEAAVAWGRQAGYERVLAWGLRGGCLLATAFHQRQPAALDGHLWWNPVLSGKTWLSQFLRLRTVARAFAGGEKESVKDLLALLEDGQRVEVAGYTLDPHLALPLAGARLDDSGTQDTPILWLEVTSGPAGELPPAAATAARKLTEGGASLQAIPVPGDGFWATQEITTCPALIEATLRQAEGLLAAPAHTAP